MMEKADSKTILCVLLTICILLATVSALASASSRTGTNDNEPAGGFSEGAEVVEIFNHTTGVHDTNFAVDENMTIRITSNSVVTLPAGNKNQIEIFDYLGNSLLNLQGFFVLEAAGPPAVFNGTIAWNVSNGIPGPGDYLLSVRLQVGGNRVDFRDVIHVGGSYLPEERYIKLYSDSGYTTESYLFTPTDTMYVEVWSGATAADNTTSTLDLNDYSGAGAGGVAISTLTSDAITQNGNYSRFSIIPTLDTAAVVFTDNWWYTLGVTMNDGAADLIVDWSVQFLVNLSGMANPPAVVAGETHAAPTPITRGSETTTIAANFSHPDSPDPNSLVVTFKVRSETNAETVLVNAKTNGQAGLTVTQDGTDTTLYEARYTWAPLVTQELGLYDLYFHVTTGLLSTLDDFGDNADELELLNGTVAFPFIGLGNTTANPSTISPWEANTTTIGVTFNHSDAPDPATFKITFKLKDPQNNPPIVLVDAALNGTQGVNVTQTGGDTYLATYVWDPPNDALLGAYDLFSRVEDANGAFAEDDFGNNADELILANVTADIQVAAGDTTAEPDFINRTGNEVTTLTARFNHSLSPLASAFMVTFKVRDPDGTTYSLVQDKKHGTGNVEVMSLGGGNFSAKYTWDPPEDQPVGTYDLYFEVEGPMGNVAIDSFDNNLEELTIDRHPFEPKATKGDLSAAPDVINVYAQETTFLNMTFFHGEFPGVDTFEVTYKVRDANGTEYLLLDKVDGTNADLQITTDSLGNYTTSARWTPPANQTLGDYDLYVKISDFNNREIEDVFDDNADELKLIYEEVPISPDDDIDPGDVENGTVNGTIKDKDGGPVAGAEVSVYDADGNLVDKLTTTATGEFTIDLPPGEYDLIISAPGYLDKMHNDILVEEGKGLDLDLQLEKDPAGDDDTDDDDDDDSGLGGVFKALVVIAVIVVLLIIIGILIFLLMRKRSGDEKEEEEPEERVPAPGEEEAAGPVGPPLPEDISDMPEDMEGAEDGGLPPGAEPLPGEEGPAGIEEEAPPGLEEGGEDDSPDIDSQLDEMDMLDIDEDVPEMEESWPDDSSPDGGDEETPSLEQPPDEPKRK